MTNTLTTDIQATIRQVKALEAAGADIVRISCPDEESTLALKSIVRAVAVPIVADGETVPVTLTFEKAGAVELTLAVKPPVVAMH